MCYSSVQPDVLSRFLSRLFQAFNFSPSVYSNSLSAVLFSHTLFLEAEFLLRISGRISIIPLSITFILHNQPSSFKFCSFKSSWFSFLSFSLSCFLPVSSPPFLIYHFTPLPCLPPLCSLFSSVVYTHIYTQRESMHTYTQKVYTHIYTARENNVSAKYGFNSKFVILGK